MKTKIMIMLLAVVSIFLVSCTTPEPVEVPVEAPPPAEVTAPPTAPPPKLIIDEIFKVEVSNTGFEPAALMIKKGDFVKFISKDGGRHWPASDIHPTHTKYPGSSINKCNGGKPTEDVFDSCKSLKEGEWFEFEFTQVGTWNYHDHLHPNLVGKVVVVE